MNNTPEISVIMAVFNAERFLRPAIESILAQTFENYEFIIVDDGSSDSTATIVESFPDARIKFVRQQHKGLVPTLNHALTLARGEFVARMDGDDISHPERLERQLEFLRSHPQHALVGATYAVVDEQDNVTRVEAVLLDDEDIRIEIAVRNPFAHGSVMLRRAALDSSDVYHDVPSAEDWDLWLRLSQRWQMANLPEVLYSWRQTAGSILHTNRQSVSRSARALQHREYIRRRNSNTLFPVALESVYAKKRALLANSEKDAFSPARVKRLAAAFRGRASVCLDFADRSGAWRELNAAGIIAPFSPANCVARMRWLASWLFFWNPRLVNDLSLWLKSKRPSPR
jgi:glycosyltransferase involved in cell wall biosynthesis